MINDKDLREIMVERWYAAITSGAIEMSRSFSLVTF